MDWLRRRHPGVTGMAKMLFDAVRAVDLLASRPDVDPGRLGSIGHSLGAKEVLYLAAFDTRIRASVSSEGGIGLTYSNWDAPWYLGDAIRRPGFPLDHGQLLALAAAARSCWSAAIRPTATRAGPTSRPPSPSGR